MGPEVDGYYIVWCHADSVQTSIQLEDRRQPPQDHRWSGPWEPFAVMGNSIVWRRPYVRD